MRQTEKVSQNWTVCVRGRTYGPYSAMQMRGFIAEERIVAESLIGRAQDGPFVPANQDPDFGDLFQSAQLSAPSPKGPLGEGEPRRSFGHGDRAGTNEPSRYLIVADMKSGSITGLEEEIFRLGPAHSVMPQAWVLASEMPIGALRNLLVQKLGKLDQLFIANATQDKVTWVNLGMETEIRVRRMWDHSPRAAA